MDINTDYTQLRTNRQLIQSLHSQGVSHLHLHMADPQGEQRSSESIIVKTPGEGFRCALMRVSAQGGWRRASLWLLWESYLAFSGWSELETGRFWELVVIDQVVTDLGSFLQILWCGLPGLVARVKVPLSWTVWPSSVFLSGLSVGSCDSQTKAI